MSEGQIEELRTNASEPADIRIASPVDGFILQRNILVGQRVDRGLELYRIADLRRVWILADVYENQLPFIHSGMQARVTRRAAEPPVPGQGERRAADLRRGDPHDEGAARDGQPRLRPQAGHVRGRGVPDRPARRPLTVPADAILDSGLRKTVFVDRGNGFFEPRQVETGWRIGDRVEITKGLMPGERIVISGTFLIDSESRMKAAAQGVFGARGEGPGLRDGRGPEDARPRPAGRRRTRARPTTSAPTSCKKKFDKEPASTRQVVGTDANPAPSPTVAMINRIIDFSVRQQVPRLRCWSAAAAVAGWWSLQHVPLDAIPDLSDTQVIIYSRWDRSPDIVEDQVTYPIVTAMLGAPKVKAVRGFSDFGYSYVYVIFEDGTDIYWARSRTLEYLSGVLPRLPAGRRRPSWGRTPRASAGSSSTRWWTRRASTAWRTCAPTRTGTCATTSSRCRAWPRWRRSAASAGSTR